MVKVICTIIASNYLGSARVLMQSVRNFEPDVRRVVLFIDEPPPDLEPDLFEVVTLKDLELVNEKAWCFKYQVVELATAVKARLLQFLFQKTGAEILVYLDPDIQVFHSLDPVWASVKTAAVALTPHYTRDFPDDGLWPHLQQCLQSGIYNLGFMAMRRCAETDDLLAWWHQKLTNFCLLEPTMGYFVDQKFMDFAPAFCTVNILKNPGCNVAFWNLHERSLEFADGQWQVGGQPLYFYHYSGYDLRYPDRLNHDIAVGQGLRREQLDGELIRRFCQEYGAKLIAARFAEYRARPYGHARFTSGRKISREVRKYYREHLEIQKTEEDPFASPFLEKKDEFLLWRSNLKHTFYRLRQRWRI